MPRNRPRSHPVDGGWLTGTPAGSYLRPSGYCGNHADSPHATADEAYQCYRKYLVEQTLRLDGRRGTPGPCKVCGRETSRTVVINGYPRDHWCDEHATVEDVTRWWNAPREEAQATA